MLMGVLKGPDDEKTEEKDHPGSMGCRQYQILARLPMYKGAR